MLLSRDGAQQAMPNDDDALLPIVRRPTSFTLRLGGFDYDQVIVLAHEAGCGNVCGARAQQSPI